MKHTAVTLSLACLVAAGLALPVLAHSGHDHATETVVKGLVKILAPKNKATVAGNVDVKWLIAKGGNVHHVHLYLDGEELGPQSGNHKQLRNLSKGNHTVKVTAATSSHHELGAETITFTVK